jgi:hypothetical protein
LHGVNIERTLGIVYASVDIGNKVAFSEAKKSLPMMFGSKLERHEVIRCLVDAFVGCSAGICRLGKKI